MHLSSPTGSEMTAVDFVAQIKTAIASITDPQISSSIVDINNCDREPIHIPAAIQPFGVLLVLAEADWRIVQVSQNTEAYLGRSPEALLGAYLADILNQSQIQAIEQCLAAAFEAVNPLRFTIAVDGCPQSFAGVVHRNEAGIVLELEPSADNQAAVSFFDFYDLLKRPVSQIQRTQTLPKLCQAAVETVKQVSGFDRVMVYQFDADGSGSVIAEAKQDELTPYLGLHYPSTDIPKQAKYLYTLNRLRLIPDATYEPVPMLPVANPLTEKPLDMSLSTLRSVSPLHTEYLANMGVRASMSISLVQDQQLWGLIACHHNSPRQLTYELRTVCEFLGQIISLELSNRRDSEDADYKMSIQTLQAEFVDVLTRSSTLQQALMEDPERLLGLVSASGAVLCEKGAIFLVGETPATDDIAPLVDWLGQHLKTDVVYQTSCLSQDYPAAQNFSQAASGLLAIAVSRVQQMYILWFRPEVIQTVDWAGNPAKPIEDEASEMRMSPRRSFELWQETVHQRSLPWQACEVEAALELRSTVIGLVLRKADELAAVNTELERSNVELDAFAYVASHDLKEPLRGIHNYSSFLIEDYGDQIGEDGNDKLQTLMRLTQRMEDLIDSLLHYSRLGRADLQIRTVDLKQLVDGVIEVVKISKSEPVTFQLPEPMPSVECDRTQVTELFTNLITNAIKYNDKAEKRIEIGYLEPDEAATNLRWPSLVDSPIESTIYYVRDNGIGIRAKHLETVFRIFKRLHPPKRFGGGTGAGLTIVKKIVERHDGQIWIDSVYGEGSTFYFTLTGQRHG